MVFFIHIRHYPHGRKTSCNYARMAGVGTISVDGGCTASFRTPIGQAAFDEIEKRLRNGELKGRIGDIEWDPPWITN